MKQLIPALLVVGTTSSPLCAQQTISAAGGRLVGGAHIIEYNIGEALIGTVAGGNATLTQGFEQPWVEITTMVPADATEDAISVYPNPVRHILNVRHNGNGDRSYMLFDARGRLVMAGGLNAMITELDTEKLESGAYVLRITTQRTQREQSFRIVITH